MRGAEKCSLYEKFKHLDTYSKSETSFPCAFVQMRNLLIQFAFFKPVRKQMKLYKSQIHRYECNWRIWKLIEPREKYHLSWCLNSVKVNLLIFQVNNTWYLQLENVFILEVLNVLISQTNFLMGLQKCAFTKKSLTGEW